MDILHHPFLFGEIPTQFQAASKGISGVVAGETSSTSIRYSITNLIALQFTLFAILLSFSSPPLLKHFCKNIKIFFRLPFSCWIFCLLVLSCVFYLLASLLAKFLWILVHLLIFLKDPTMMN